MSARRLLAPLEQTEALELREGRFRNGPLSCGVGMPVTRRREWLGSTPQPVLERRQDVQPPDSVRVEKGAGSFPKQRLVFEQARVQSRHRPATPGGPAAGRAQGLRNAAWISPSSLFSAAGVPAAAIRLLSRGLVVLSSGNCPAS